MDTLIIVIPLGMLGAVLGSFIGAQVWRLRARQLSRDRELGERVDHKEYTSLRRLVRPISVDRSECLHCHHKLAWYDMVPIVSWAILGGKCHYCRARIGLMEPLLEISLAAVFVVSYVCWPFELSGLFGWIQFSLWLVAAVLMAILFAYDARWSLLPFGINIALIVVSVAFFGLSAAIIPIGTSDWLSLLGALAILAGLYYLFSLPGWVGLGDSILGVGLALLLMHWERAFLALFIANLAGSLMILPLAAHRKLKRGLHIPFGPFLILGAWIALLWGDAIIAFILSWSGVLSNPFML